MKTEMRIPKTITLNIEVVKAFEEIVPAYQRSRVIDALILEYLVEHHELNGLDLFYSDKEDVEVESEYALQGIDEAKEKLVKAILNRK